MQNLVFSPISTDSLIKKISDQVTENVLQLLETNKPASEQDEFLTPKETAEMLRISLVTLWRWEKQGKVKCYGIGGRRLYKKSEVVESLIEKQ